MDWTDTKTFNPNKQLCRSNIEINTEKNILLINISWSKTIQFGERNLIAGEFLEVGTNEIILWYALTEHRGESGILIGGTIKFRSPNCIVFDHDMLIKRIFFSLLISMLLLHNCLFGLNVFVSVQSIKNYISGVKTLHLYTENEFPQKDTFQISWIVYEVILIL
jgi:hypothetical protein